MPRRATIALGPCVEKKFAVVIVQRAIKEGMTPLLLSVTADTRGAVAKLEPIEIIVQRNVVVEKLILQHPSPSERNVEHLSASS